MLKKTVALLLALLLMCLSAGAESQSAAEKMASRWLSSLTAEETLYQSQMRMYDAIIAFDEERTWENLLRARAAAAVALTTRSGLAKFTPEPVLSAMEQASLVMAGVEVAAYQNNMDDLNLYLAREIEILLGICDALEEGVLRQDGLRSLADWARDQRCSAEADARYLCLMTNNLCITLGDDALAASLWDALAEVCPGIAAYRGPYRTDADEIFNLAVAEVDLREELNNSGTARLGESQNELNRTLYDAEHGNAVFTADDVVAVEGMPPVIPRATWLDVDMDYHTHYIMDEEGHLVRIDLQSDPAVVPMISAVTTSDVPKSVVVGYVERLLELGFEVERETGSMADTEAWSCTLGIGRVQLIFNWSEVNVTLWNVGNYVAYVPDWYATLAD